MKMLCIGDLVADLVVPISELPLRPEKHQLANDCLLQAALVIHL
jgi:hypothetical protein